jgi:hypothetical protein
MASHLKWTLVYSRRPTDCCAVGAELDAVAGLIRLSTWFAKRSNLGNFERFKADKT